MSDYIALGHKVSEFSTSELFDSYSKVTINVTEELSYSVGTDTGRELVLDCPWGTQEMAQNILNSLSGFQYQPYEATGALLDPAAEYIDGVTINGVYSGIYEQNINFGYLYSADIAAPEDEAIDHEYPYETSSDRKITRLSAYTKSEFAIQADQIAAKVEQQGGDSSSFGWTLTADGFVLSSGSSEVFRCDENGISVTGNITATSGYIGNGSSGFTIGSRAIYNGMTSYSDTENNGIYLGTDGIALGKGAFKVNSSGALYATSGTFTGAVWAKSIQYGGSAGTFSGSGLTGYSVGTGQVSSYLNGGVSGGYYANDVFSAARMASTGWFSSIRLGSTGTQCTLQTMSFVDYYGNTRSYRVVMSV